MDYSALVFADTLKSEIEFKELERIINEFVRQQDCKQIVLSVPSEWILRITQNPFPKTTFVSMSSKVYVALLNGLKAISQENVLVTGLSKSVDHESIEKVKEELSLYPAIYYDPSLQAFDTRLVMFCLQVAIESNLAIDSYAKAVEALGNTPLKYIQ